MITTISNKFLRVALLCLVPLTMRCSDAKYYDEARYIVQGTRLGTPLTFLMQYNKARKKIIGELTGLPEQIAHRVAEYCPTEKTTYDPSIPLDGSICSCDVTHKGVAAVSFRATPGITFYDIKQNRVLGQINNVKKIAALRFTHDGTMLMAALSKQAKIFLWTLQYTDSQVLAQDPAIELAAEASEIDYLPQSHTFATYGHKWGVYDTKKNSFLETQGPCSPEIFKWSPDETLLFAIQRGYQYVHAYAVDTGKRNSNFTLDLSQDFYIRAAAVSSTRSILALVRGYDIVLHAISGDALAKTPLLKIDTISKLESITFSPVGDLLAVASNNQVIIYDAIDGTQLQYIHVPSLSCRPTLKFLPSGELVALPHYYPGTMLLFQEKQYTEPKE